MTWLTRSRRTVGLALLLLGGTAHADAGDDARRHFKAGLEAAATGSYAQAVEEFRTAWDAVPHPSTAFNIARAYEDLGRPTDALAWYEAFAALAPERAREVDAPLARVRQVIGLSAAQKAVSTDPTAAVARLRALDAERDALMGTLLELNVDVLDLAVTGPSLPPAAAPTDADVQVAPAPVAKAPPKAAEPSEAQVPVEAREALLTDAYDKVVVTASRYGQDPLDSPSSVTILTREQLRQTGAVHLADALRRVPGVDVMSMSAGVPYLGIRGFNAEMPNKVLWLVDGRPTSLEFLAMPMPVSIPVSLDEIERIEIIRGPGSAIYGANAVTGVVNIITTRPGEGKRFTSTVKGGFNRFAAADVTASGSTGPVAYRASAGYQQEGRFEKELADIPADGPIAAFRTDQDTGDQRYRGALRFDTTFADKGWASISGGYGRGFTEFYSKAALGNASLDGEIGHVRGDLGYGPGHLRVYWQREAGAVTPWLTSSGSSRSTVAQVLDDIVDIELEGNFEAQTGDVDHRIHVGADYRYKVYRAGVPGFGFEIPRPEHHAAVFAQYQLHWKWLTAVAALRWDRHPLIDASRTFAPRGSLVFRVAKSTSIRASAGTAYRAMNGLESYVNLDLNTTADGYYVSFVGAGTAPDDVSLRPESITTVELGARDESSPYHALDVAIYWNRLTDLIDIGSVQPTLGGFFEDSAGFPFGQASWVNDTTFYDAIGGEVDLTVFPVDGLDVFLNGAFTRILGTNDGGTFVDASTALAHVNAGLTYRSPVRVDVSFAGHLVTNQTWRVPQFDSEGSIVRVEKDNPARFLMSLRVAGRPVTKPELELSATLWNPLGFFDATAFREHPDGQRLGPRLYGEARLSF